MRRIIYSTVFIAAMALLVIAVIRRNSHKPEVTIGLAVANLQANFFNQIKQSVEAQGKAHKVKVITVDAKGDSATQVNQIQDLITQKILALIYIPAGAEAAAVPVELARAAGIPVVAVDRNPADSPADTFIASDSIKAARTLGEYVIGQTAGTGKVAIIRGQIGTTPEMEREQGFHAALAEAQGLVVVQEQASKAWMQDEGFNIAQDMLQLNPDISVFFGHSDSLALGASRAVEVANMPQRILIVGFDGDVAALQAIAAGTLDATMTQQTKLMGKVAFESALRLINGESVPSKQLQEATLTTKENVAGFIGKHP